MRISDCKVGDWLVIQDSNSSETRIHTPTIAKVVSVTSNMVTVEFAKHTRWDLVESEDRVLRSDAWMGEPAIPLEPTGFDTYKDRCRVITKDHEFDVTREVGEEIKKHYGFEPDNTQGVPKLKKGDMFVYTEDIWGLCGHMASTYCFVGKTFNITDVTETHYEFGGGARGAIPIEYVDPYLPQKDLSGLQGGGEPIYDYHKTPPSHSVELLTVQRHKIKDRTKITLTPELNKLIGAGWDTFIGSKVEVCRAYNQYSLWLKASHSTMFNTSINATKLENFLFSKPGFMTRLLSKLKKLRMSKDDKDLLAAGFIDENGDPTQDGLYAYSVIMFDEKEVRAKLADYARKIKDDKNECDCD